MRLPILLAALVLLVPAASGFSAEGMLGEAGGADRYIVGFREMPDLEPGDTYQGERVVDASAPLRFIVVETHDFAAFELRARLDGNVRYLEYDDPEYARVAYAPNDARYDEAGHWGSKKINAAQAWDATLGSASVKVAVIDSGLLKTHEEFAGSARVLQGWDTISEDNDPQDNCGHGTHVAGTIGATIDNGKGIAGMAQVSIIPIRALTNSLLLLCSGSTSDLAQALAYAGDQGAHFSSNSWGGGTSASITDAIDYAHGKGVIHVAAAGNDGSCTDCVSEPWRSNAAKVIIVSSTNQNDGLSSFSSQGPQVDVAAPGSSILSSYNGGATSYTTLSGTSMAAPHVTGAAALVKTLNPTWGFAQIDQRLKATAVDLGIAGKDDAFGHGRIDAAAAVGTGGTPGNAPPSAIFTDACTGLACAFDGSSSADGDGTIVSYAWNFGDGTGAAGATASHTYGAGGTYAVALTVTDDDGATATTTRNVTVTSGGDPDPGAPTLENGVARSATSGGMDTSQHYKILVPAGASQLQVVLDGPACGLLNCPADLDLYVRKGARATDADYDCRPFQAGSDETCTHANPGADWWYVRVTVFSGSSAEYTIKATTT